MASKRDDSWYRSLTGKTVGKYKLLEFIGAGNIGSVYRAEHCDFPGAERAVKLIFDKLAAGWDVELKKVIRLAQVQGVVQFHALDTVTITHNGEPHFAQYTVWDYIAPGENLTTHLKRVRHIETSFLVAVVERILYVGRDARKYPFVIMLRQPRRRIHSFVVITSDLADVFWQPSRMASSYIRYRTTMNVSKHD